MKMNTLEVAILCIFMAFIPLCAPHPQHEYHRIHIPTKIKTIYRTKVIKIPEHHHYFHTKEKIIKIPHDDLLSKYDPEPIKLEEDIKLSDSHTFDKLPDTSNDFHGDDLGIGNSYLSYPAPDQHIISGSEKHHVYKKPRRNKRRGRTRHYST